MTVSLATPQLPVSLGTLNLNGEDQLWDPEPEGGFRHLFHRRTVKPLPLVECVGWGNSDLTNLSQLELGNFRVEL